MATQLDPSQLLGFRHVSGLAFANDAIAKQADRGFNRIGGEELNDLDRAFNKISQAEMTQEGAEAPRDSAQELDRLFNKVGQIEIE
jgi:hypothetical protein